MTTDTYRYGPKEKRVFAFYLLKFINERGWNNKTAAHHFGIATSTLSLWLAGIGLPHRFIKKEVFRQIGIDDLRQLTEKLEQEAA